MLDENEIKTLSIVDYNQMKWYETDSIYFVFAHSDERTRKSSSLDDDLNEIQVDVENPHYIEPSRKFIAWKNKCFKDCVFFDRRMPNDEFRLCKDPYKECCLKFWSRQEILDYLKIIPFVPSVMINISPDWESCDKRSNPCKIKILKGLIDNYMKEQWYSKWSYVIENGSDGNHIHAHIVAEFNTKRIKSVESHLRKGNHTQQLKKYSKKIKGMEGMIKGVSVQKMFLRTEEIVKDKLDYLVEDKKPIGHKNKSIINDGFVTGCL
jgi:hypothetical protein